MILRRNERSGPADLVEDFFDARIHMGSRAGQKPITDSVSQDAAIGHGRNRQPRYVIQRLR